MAEYNPIFRSPIAVSEPAAAASDLTLSDITGAPVILIQGNAGRALKNYFADIPAKPGSLVKLDKGLLGRLTPRELYLFGLSPAAGRPAVAELSSQVIHATDLTHGVAALKISGPPAAEALSKICGLDFHDSEFPNLQIKQTSAAKIKTLIARCDEDGTPVYHLHVSRPYGQYFWEIVWDAGQEFGIGVG